MDRAQPRQLSSCSSTVVTTTAKYDSSVYQTRDCREGTKYERRRSHHCPTTAVLSFKSPFNFQVKPGKISICGSASAKDSSKRPTSTASRQANSAFAND